MGRMLKFHWEFIKMIRFQYRLVSAFDGRNRCIHIFPSCIHKYIYNCILVNSSVDRVHFLSLSAFSCCGHWCASCSVFFAGVCFECGRSTAIKNDHIFRIEFGGIFTHTHTLVLHSEFCKCHVSNIVSVPTKKWKESTEALMPQKSANSVYRAWEWIWMKCCIMVCIHMHRALTHTDRTPNISIKCNLSLFVQWSAKFNQHGLYIHIFQFMTSVRPSSSLCSGALLSLTFPPIYHTYTQKILIRIHLLLHISMFFSLPLLCECFISSKISFIYPCVFVCSLVDSAGGVGTMLLNLPDTCIMHLACTHFNFLC